MLIVCIIIFFSIIAAICVIRSIFLIVTVEHQSMLPTLQHGDRVLALRRGFHRWIRRGSIVLVPPPDSDDLPEHFGLYIKRVVALGEATITLPFPQQNSPSFEHTTAQQDVPEEKTWQIPRNHLFVCGDNRANSIDSRRWGPIPLSNIRGLVLSRLRPASSRAMAKEARTLASSPNQLQPGDPAPAFSIVSLQGETIVLQAYQGKVVLLLFLAPGALMRQCLPSYLAFAQRLEAFEVCTILAYDAAYYQMESWVEELAVCFPVLAVSPRQCPLLQEYRISFTPAYCLIGTDGCVLTSGLAMMGASFWQEDILSSFSHHQREVV